MKKDKKRALVLEIPRLLLVAERGLVTSHLRALLGAINLFSARAQIVVIRGANDKEARRRFDRRKRKGMTKVIPQTTDKGFGTEVPNLLSYFTEKQKYGII